MWSAVADFWLLIKSHLLRFVNGCLTPTHVKLEAMQRQITEYQ
jgi:hypothetical protein